MRDEWLKPQHRVVAPIGSAIALPPGAADGVRAHAEPHAELKDPRKGAGGRKAHDQSLKNAEPGIGLHDANQTQNGVGGHETVGVERHREIVFAAPALAEITDVAGLVAGVDRAAPVGDRDPVAPARGQRREARLLVACDRRRRWCRSAHRDGNARRSRRRRDPPASARDCGSSAPAIRCGCTTGSRSTPSPVRRRGCAPPSA